MSVVFLEALAGEGALTAFAGDNSRNPLSFSQSRNSARKMDGLGNPAKMASMVSRTTRFTPIESMA
jgi:hypothetical protein